MTADATVSTTITRITAAPIESAPGRPARHPGGPRRRRPRPHRCTTRAEAAPTRRRDRGVGSAGLGGGPGPTASLRVQRPAWRNPLPGEHDDGPPAATLNLPAGCRVKPAVARRACPGADRGPGRARPVRAPHPRHTGRGPIASGAGRHIDGTSLSAAMWSRPPTPNACHVPRHGPTVGRAERGHRADATALAVRVKQVGTNAPRSAARPARRRAAV